MSGLLDILLGQRRGLLDNPDRVEALRESLPAGPRRDEVRTPSPGFRELDTRDPTARMALRAGVGQTVDDTARMYRQATDAAGWGGTMAAGRGIRAFHGSPHDFDRFRMDRIGTGEGAQAYGHGLYFAENEGVARGYRDTLSGRVNQEQWRALNLNDTPYVDAARSMWNTHSPDEIRSILRSAYRNPALSDQQLDLVMQAANPGRMYEVNLRTSPDRLIDWAAPVSQQPAPVQDALRSLGSRVGDVPMYHAINRGRKNEYFAGDLVGTDRATPAEMSARLRDAGVEGIRYLDLGSRGAGTGTQNYVMFDDALIDILRRYAMPGLLGGGTAAAGSEGLLQ